MNPCIFTIFTKPAGIFTKVWWWNKYIPRSLSIADERDSSDEDLIQFLKGINYREFYHEHVHAPTEYIQSLLIDIQCKLYIKKLKLSNY